MRTRDLAALVAGVIVFGFIVDQVRAHDPYSSWKTHNGGSCCTPRKVDKHGNVSGDCRPVRARPNAEATGWEYWHELQRAWLPVPAQAVRPIDSPDGRSHICEMQGLVLCFVPGEIRT